MKLLVNHCTKGMVYGFKEAVDLTLNGYRVVSATKINDKYILVMWNSKKGQKITMFLHKEVYYLKKKDKVIKSVHTKNNDMPVICHVDFENHCVVIIKPAI